MKKSKESHAIGQWWTTENRSFLFREAKEQRVYVRKEAVEKKGEVRAAEQKKDAILTHVLHQQVVVRGTARLWIMMSRVMTTRERRSYFAWIKTALSRKWRSMALTFRNGFKLMNAPERKMMIIASN